MHGLCQSATPAVDRLTHSTLDFVCTENAASWGQTDGPKTAKSLIQRCRAL